MSGLGLEPRWLPNRLITFDLLYRHTNGWGFGVVVWCGGGGWVL